MRKLTGAVFISLDGIMQAPGAPEEDRSGGFRLGGWTFPFHDESTEEPMSKLVVEPEYDLLLGKRTYDIFSAFWPYNEEGPIGEKFNRINKYVLTHSSEALTWQPAEKLSGDTATAVAELKQKQGRDLLIQGSSTLYPPLLSAGLIDELVLMIFPVVLGQGKSIFDGTQAAARMRMTNHFVSRTGVIFVTYEPNGEVPTGTFATKPPSAQELERREKIRRVSQ